MPAGYVTAFEVSRYANLGFPAFGLIFVVIGGAVAFLKRRFGWQRPGRLFLFGYIGFGMLFALGAGLGILLENNEAYQALHFGQHETVEGPVTDFKPMPYEGHQDECFSVQQHTFCYSDYVVTAGFHQSASHGGPVREGLPVRIAYTGNLILKLEIPADAQLSSQQQAAIAARNEEQMQGKVEADPHVRRLNLGFLIAALCWAIWMNMEYRRWMRCWLKPPYQKWTVVLFRVLAAVALLGISVTLISQFRNLPKTEVLPAMESGALITGVVLLFFRGGLFFMERRDRKNQAIAAMR